MHAERRRGAEQHDVVGGPAYHDQDRGQRDDRHGPSWGARRELAAVPLPYGRTAARCTGHGHGDSWHEGFRAWDSGRAVVHAQRVRAHHKPHGPHHGAGGASRRYAACGDWKHDAGARADALHDQNDFYSSLGNSCWQPSNKLLRPPDLVCGVAPGRAVQRSCQLVAVGRHLEVSAQNVLFCLMGRRRPWTAAVQQLVAARRVDLLANPERGSRSGTALQRQSQPHWCSPPPAGRPLGHFEPAT